MPDSRVVCMFSSSMYAKSNKFLRSSGHAPGLYASCNIKSHSMEHWSCFFCRKESVVRRRYDFCYVSGNSEGAQVSRLPYTGDDPRWGGLAVLQWQIVKLSSFIVKCRPR
jgi:hypothetical protein